MARILRRAGSPSATSGTTILSITQAACGFGQQVRRSLWLAYDWTEQVVRILQERNLG